MNEFDVIAKFFVPLTNNYKGAYGLKDDVAFIDGIILTSDTLVEETHFRTQDDIKTIGQKLVRVNLSDIICKGAMPEFSILNLSWPSQRRESDLIGFCEGLKTALNEFGIPLIGGDTTKTNGPLIVSMTMGGRPLKSGPILRHKGKIGDAIFVSGDIGCAKVGFDALNTGNGDFDFCKHHFQIPQIPKLKLAELIADFASSSLDVSDGLLGDCKKLCQEDSEIKLNLERIPFHREVENWLKAHENHEKAILELASWGDDYQSIFCVEESNIASLLKAAKSNEIKITRIGEIVSKGAGGLFNRDNIILDPLRSSYSHEL